MHNSGIPIVSYWDSLLREDLGSKGQMVLFEKMIERRKAVEQHKPTPPTWLRSLALEPGFAAASPLLLSYAHGLLHDPCGVDAKHIPHVFSTAAWIQQTALKTQDDLRQEARRFALLLDAVVRVWIPVIYESEGCTAEAKALRELPQVHTLRAVLVATKVIVGFLEAELKNVSHRPPNAHILFATILRQAALTCIGFDHVVQAARNNMLVPPLITVEMVRRVISIFGIARRSPDPETMDSYAVAIIGMMSQVDQSILADINVAA